MTQYQKVDASTGALLRADILVVLMAIVIGLGLTSFLNTGNAPYLEKVDIKTSFSALPMYAILSLTRSIIALIFSIFFAIVYGTIAARSKSCEKVLIPLLDVLQSLPVVAFLPGFVLTLVFLFPHSHWGLEIACLLTIFTGQVWNLAFAYFESQRTLQPEFNEVAQIYNLSPIQKFFFVDLPNGYRPLIYNGMMSMAGGWFFFDHVRSLHHRQSGFQAPRLGLLLV